MRQSHAQEYIALVVVYMENAGPQGREKSQRHRFHSGIY